MANRDATGRFAGGESRKPSFDLVASLKRLFTAAEKAGDYGGASTVARTIATLGADAPEEQSEENLSALATFEERLTLHDIITQLQAWKTRVRDRLGVPQPPPGLLDRPPVASNYCPRCAGYPVFWSLDDARQADLAFEFFGEGQMKLFLEFVDAKEAVQ